MPPRKRRAAPKLQAIDEQAEQLAEPEPPAKPSHNKEALIAKLEEIDERVEESASQLWNAAVKDVERLRASFKVKLLTIPKKVQTMSCAQFLGLSELEAQLGHIQDLPARLATLESASDAPAGRPRAAKQAEAASTSTHTEPPAQQPAPQELKTSTDALVAATPAACLLTTRVTRRTAARTGATLDTGLLATAMTTRRTRAATKATTEPQASQLEPQPSAVLPPPPAAQPPAAVTPKRPPRVRAGKQVTAAGSITQEGQQGAPTAAASQRGPLQDVDNNTGPPAAASPEPASKKQAEVAATPACHTAAAGFEPAPAGALTVAPTGVCGKRAGTTTQHQVLGGFTLIRQPAVRGRTRGARTGAGAAAAAAAGGGDANAMLFTTTDGREFTVDADKGLAGVPEQYRPEIQRQIEQLQRLANAALAKC